MHASLLSTEIILNNLYFSYKAIKEILTYLEGAKKTHSNLGYERVHE